METPAHDAQSGSKMAERSTEPPWRIIVTVAVIVLLVLAFLLYWLRRDPCPPTALDVRGEGNMTHETEAIVYYLAGLVVAEQGAVVDSPDLELLDAAGIDDALRCSSNDKMSDPDSGALLDEFLDLYQFDPDRDPSEFVGQFPVAPIHVVAPEVHWSFEPGGEAAKPHWSFVEAFGGTVSNPVELAGDDKIVAVVDTGYVETGIAYLDDFVIWDPSRDADSGIGLGHGVHIASLIRQVAPNARVSLVKAAPSDSGNVLRPRVHGGEEALSEGLPFTNELEVFKAILRLIERHADEEVHALNLSLGTWADELTEASPVRVALEMWWTSRPGRSAPVYAAAGNNNPSGISAETEDEAALLQRLEFYPAALNGEGEGARYPLLVAVQPLDHAGDPVYWTQNGARATFGGHAWATEGMLGVDLLGVCGPTAEMCVGSGATNAAGEVAPFASWSGGSFATPVAAATGINQPNGLVPQGLDYTNVPGLSYLPAP